jgi:hypothetical protein
MRAIVTDLPLVVSVALAPVGGLPRAGRPVTLHFHIMAGAETCSSRRADPPFMLERRQNALLEGWVPCPAGAAVSPLPIAGPTLSSLR